MPIGIPRILVTNNGRKFDNSKFREYCNDNSIELHFISVAHPQANGQEEVANRIILDGLKKMAVVPLEITHGSIRIKAYERETSEEGMRLALDLIDKVRDEANARNAEL
ncbi:uncharacterized protein LOC141696664 [Apium graveolens]|uniref:uncharacterized protein LOC141696664 n=1 Tax=Apium graveolens TaxID=4045 RepID=UPI003D7A150B